jgi:hypothetical protein
VTLDLPDTWAGLFDRLAQVLGGAGGRPEGVFYEEAERWFREAVEATYGVTSLRDLDRGERARAFQRACGTLAAVYDACADLGCDLAFTYGSRDVLRRCFARTWGGAALDGPPWRLDPSETDRPTHEEWATADDFGAPPSPEAGTVA